MINPFINSPDRHLRELTFGMNARGVDAFDWQIPFNSRKVSRIVSEQNVRPLALAALSGDMRADIHGKL
jgi:hypothetical protein